MWGFCLKYYKNQNKGCTFVETNKENMTLSKSVEQIKSELTNKEVKSFETLVRLGDSIQLAYETVLNERTKEDSTEFYRNAYEN
jgi:hypothetical protein